MAEKRHKKDENLYAKAPPEMQRHLGVASGKGASNWVTAMPSFDHDTVLHKGEFTDAIYTRYGWEIPDLPLTCPCGASFRVQHALDCMLGGFRTIQHNEVRDVLADATPRCRCISGRPSLLLANSEDPACFLSHNQPN